MALSKQAIRTAHAFRLGEAARGADMLVALIESLERTLHASPERARAVLPILMRAHEAQARGDHLHLADLLEHELAHAV